ncbi:hypothetical protein ABPG77_004809 [Micractinium sp. CCAP 211/92]
MQALPIAGAAAVLLVKSLRDGTMQRRRLESVMDEYRQLFDIPTDRLLALRDALVQQLEAGLAGQPGGLMALPSYVDVLPTGHESGDCYAVDLGGTNLRVAHVKLAEGRGVTEAVHIREWAIPEEHFDTNRGSLLRFVAQRTVEVIREHSGGAGSGGPGSKPVVGFCFSFPVDQTALDNGKVVVWTKNFRGTYLIGQDVVAALRAELAAAGVEAEVPAVMNDTVATLVAMRYSEPDTQLGIILGTGTNCAYLERAEAISKLPAGYRGRTPHMVVNSEWGDFRSPLLPSCQEDLWVDFSSPHPGNGLFEKQISGLYLGEIARRILLRLAEKEGLFGGTLGLLGQHFVMTTADMAACDQDDTPDLRAVASTLERVLEIRKTSLQQRRLVQEVCQLVCLRSARLCAAAITGMLQRMGHPCGSRAAGGSGSAGPAPPVVVAVDGSVFEKYDKFRERLRAALEDVCGNEAADSVRVKLAKDGSVLGAAYLGVAAAQFEGRADAA